MNSTARCPWKSEEIDLEPYLTRIGYADERVATTRALRALHRAHVTSIPFETIDIVAQRPVSLDLSAVQDKLVERRRGGYCYEHVVLFAAVLERFGFGVTGLHARVTADALRLLGLRTRVRESSEVRHAAPRPNTHAILLVTTADSPNPWICDVGFGGGPLEPVELVEQGSQEQHEWAFALRREAGEDYCTDLWRLRQYGPEGWLDRYTFTLTPQYTVDYEIGNHYLTTHPSSVFRRNLFVQRFLPERHDILHGTTWFTVRPGLPSEERTIPPEDVPWFVHDFFGIDAEVDSSLVPAA
ncbi:acetyltransferase [Actinopolyspora erythraea]|uniref:Acetyltransferase n=1 Tax=Actinopolyspora erythraea TaxID=414996 RepID=A0A099D5Y5_9ACTN|nr:arylamine N-acetyltransferase [Actinopolyspora erythraea]ASU81061.1 acetyltransferase [Actinopolyspora erythraea]KGI81351.1 acetyltransferase [Actinopolyspora erythraea]